MANEESFQRIAERLRIVAEPNRLRLIQSLLVQEQTVGDLATRTGLEQSLVSHHLCHLREGGWVLSRRVGRKVWYRLGDAVQPPVGSQCLNLGCCTLRLDDNLGLQGSQSTD